MREDRVHLSPPGRGEPEPHELNFIIHYLIHPVASAFASSGWLLRRASAAIAS